METQGEGLVQQKKKRSIGEASGGTRERGGLREDEVKAWKEQVFCQKMFRTSLNFCVMQVLKKKQLKKKMRIGKLSPEDMESNGSKKSS